MRGLIVTEFISVDGISEVAKLPDVTCNDEMNRFKEEELADPHSIKNHNPDTASTVSGAEIARQLHPDTSTKIRRTRERMPFVLNRWPTGGKIVRRGRRPKAKPNRPAASRCLARTRCDTADQ